MTTHDEQTKTAAASTADEVPTSGPESSDEMEPPTARTDPSADVPRTEDEPPTRGDESPTARTEPSQMGAQPSAERST